jgi:hypothetical protein
MMSMKNGNKKRKLQKIKKRKRVNQTKAKKK